MTAPANKITMLSFFTKLPSIPVEEANPRKLAPAFNKQHVEEFQKDRLERFDAELYRLNNEVTHVQTPMDGVEQEQDRLVPASNGDNHTPIVDYIASIKSGHYRPFRVDRKPKGPLRAKLLQYSEDVRPAYYGTWQKKTTRITGRRPYCMDESVFDYEVDSEAEWDIGGPGESLKGDDSEDEEELDDYEIDMKTFVPHGYVSDDEVDVHSDQEENNSSSANQSVEVDDVLCDADESSNMSIKIICEKRVKLNSVPSTNKQSNSNGNNTSKKSTPTKVNPPCQQQAPTPQMKQPKLDIKPIVLGIYYEHQQPAIISESKIHFLKSFQGFMCS